jgi:hypothetical protein
MTSSAAPKSFTKRLAAGCAVVGLAAIGLVAMPGQANAWWYNHGWGYGVGVYVPPVVVAPAPVYYPAPSYYYAPPVRAWIPAHYQNGYYIPGHWS